MNTRSASSARAPATYNPGDDNIVATTPPVTQAPGRILQDRRQGRATSYRYSAWHYNPVFYSIEPVQDA